MRTTFGSLQIELVDVQGDMLLRISEALHAGTMCSAIAAAEIKGPACRVVVLLFSG